MTGTVHYYLLYPKFSSVKFLQSDGYKNSLTSALTFKDKFIKRNDDDLNLHPLIDNVEWVDLSPTELALYKFRVGQSREDPLW
jgi:hypothetical protein